MTSGNGTGRSVIFGNGHHLIDDPDAMSFDISELIDTDFTVSKFVDSAIWLNNTIGYDNWCYDGMRYYFSNERDLMMFKLGVLHDK